MRSSWVRSVRRESSPSNRTLCRGAGWLVGLSVLALVAVAPSPGMADDFEEIEAVDEGDDFADLDGFEAVDDEEFAPLDAAEIRPGAGGHLGRGRNLRLVLTILGITLLAGILVRFRSTRALRPLFLLGAVVYLGFIHGACPCPISSMQNLFLWSLGSEICSPYSFIWFLGLIPITYLVGRVWCGWLCHLGALQEFIYRTNHFEFLKGSRAQLIMRILRYGFAVGLIVQLVVTQKNWFIHIDPFKVAYNLTSYYTVGWVLLGLVLLTSLFIYKPFCRSVCPLGLILGWISRVPGAFVLGRSDKCRICKLCSSACHIQALERVDTPAGRDVIFRPADCEMCGDCIEACRKGAICSTRAGRDLAQEPGR